jgi:hypothetical protein
MRLIFVCGFVLACGDGSGDDGGGGGDDGGGEELDADSDGYTTPADCDDVNPDVHPDAPEQCDGIDQDCDDEIDENPTNGISYYPDGDGDGFGSSAAPVTACTAPIGYADNSNDCNDGDATLNPSTAWYTDDDADGYGTVIEMSGCIGPAGTSLEDGDCDDKNASNHPGADEVCDDVDNDCDSTKDEDPVNAPTWYADSDGDEFGDAAAPQVDCWRPISGYTDDASDCDDTNGAVYPGAIETCGDALDADCTGRTDNGCEVLYASDLDDTYLGETERDSFGESLASLGDRDGDGQEDLAFGSPNVMEATNGFEGAGAVYVMATPGDGLDASAVDETDIRLSGDGTQDGFGQLVENGGDVNGDGEVDLIVGARNDNVAACDYCGDIRIFLGPLSDGLVQSDADIQVPWEDRYSQFGDGAAHGDFDSDGTDDVIVAGSNVALAKKSYNDGVVLFFRGPVSSGVLDPAKADASMWGDSHAGVGSGLTDPSDVDGDGVNDMAIGASGFDTSGAVFLFLGPISGALAAATADVTYEGESTGGGRFGTRVEWGGDLDGDGTVDLLASSPGAGELVTDGGAICVFYGPLDTSMGAADATATLEGSSAHGNFGSSIDAGRDVDGDGFDDVLVGANSDDTSGNGAGAAYLFYAPFVGPRGAVGADAIFYGSDRDQAGNDAAIVEYDGDGSLDLVVGAPNSSDGTGRVYLVPGVSFL